MGCATSSGHDAVTRDAAAFRLKACFNRVRGSSMAVFYCEEESNRYCKSEGLERRCGDFR